MTKAGKFWLIAVVMGVLGLIETVTGFVLWLAFPEGGGGGRFGGGGIGDLTYWGMTKHTWIDIHDWVAVALVAVAVLHIVIHWKWIIRVARNLFKARKELVSIAAGTTTAKG